MGRMMKAIVLVLTLTLGLGACGEAKKVGTEVNTDVEGGGGPRLGETPTPDPNATPPAAAIGGAQARATPTPRPVVTPRPTPTPREKVYTDIFLVTNSPYYEPAPDVTIPRGNILRVTNRDTIPERKFRTYTAQGAGGSFTSPQLKPGDKWEFAPPPGQYKVTDQGLTFAQGNLTVS